MLIPCKSNNHESSHIISQVSQYRVKYIRCHSTEWSMQYKSNTQDTNEYRITTSCVR